MPYCPNPECPFRRRFGESAEYREGSTTCSDCGALLSDKDVLGPRPQEPKKQLSFALTDAHKRILWTLALVTLWRILSHVSLPGIDYGALSGLIRSSESPFSQIAPLGLFSLGLMAYVSAYVIVEILALFIQPLKRWKFDEGQGGRKKLVLTARGATLLIAIYHANALVSMTARMGDGNMLLDNGPGFQALLVLTLVGGLFLTVWVADTISMRGVGHGVSILFLTSELGSLPRATAKLFSFAKEDGTKMQVIAALLIIAGLITLIILVEKVVRRFSFRRRDGTEVLVPIKLTTAGTVPLEWAAWIIGLPVLILGTLPAEIQAQQHVLRWLAGNSPQSLGRGIIYGVIIVALYYVFTAFFHDPRKISADVDLADRNGSLTPDAVRAMDRGLEVMALVASLYLIVLAYAQDALWAWFGIPLVMSGLTLLLVVCIALDIYNEVRLRWHSGDLVRVAETHEPWKAGLLRDLLQEKAISSVIRGYHHRSLKYFFGPYIEMSLLVPEEHAEEAQAVVRANCCSLPTAVTSSS